MLDIILENIKRVVKSRLFPMLLIYFALFTILVVRLFQLQIVQGDEVAEEIRTNTEEVVDIKSTRGNIRDRNGKLLAYNEVAYSVTVKNIGGLDTNEEKNAMLAKMIELIEKNGGRLDYDFQIKMDTDGSLYFGVDGSSLERFKKDVYAVERGKGLSPEQESADAEEVFRYLRYDTGSNSISFGIDGSYTREEALKIMSVRFALYLNQWRKYVPVTVAVDVNEKIVAALEENRAELPGVEIQTETNRVYKDSEYYASILGYTGLATEDDIEELEKEGDDEGYYNLTDQVGKTGLEKRYEDQLRGAKGSETLIIDNSSKRAVGTKDRKEPVAGNDLYLTLDSDLQKAAYQLGEKEIAGILLSKIVNSTSTGSKGRSADGILVPIYDVYFALIDNNTIDISQFSEPDATNLEKAVYRKYLDKRKQVFTELDRLLSFGSKTTNEEASEEMSEYLSDIYEMLAANRILLKDAIDKNDETYLKYAANKISLCEFLTYALSQKWIDLEKLDIGNEYYSTKELYGILIKKVKSLLENESSFNKKLYRFLVYSYKLSGKEICLLLFDQGVIKYNKKDAAALKNGSLDPYTFIRSKIRSLEITPGQLALTPCSFSAVVTDVNTGDVLACVTYPSYDNNKFANKIDSEYFAKLQNDKTSPLMNRPTRQKTAPGSTFKPISATTLLEEGVLTTSDSIVDKVRFDTILPPAHCWKSSGHGTVNVQHAIGVSCNYFFFEWAYRMSLDGKGVYNSDRGLKKLKKYASLYGLDAVSGIELYEDEPQISDYDCIRSAIGQGEHNYTPTQLSRYVTTIANNGTCYNLTIVDKIKDLEGKTVVDNKAGVYHKVSLNPITWDVVHNGMYEVVNGPESSISSLFKDMDTEIAGKTGTAQITKEYPNHGLFISYAPFDKPEISITVVLPNGFASSNAAELARNIYRYYFEKDGKEKKKLLSRPVSEPELKAGYTD